MGLGGFTLADRLGAKSSPCTVPGCARTWISMVSAKGAKLGGRGAADPSDPASSMCDPCRQVLAKATDAQRPCARAGCDGTWTWPALDQVAAAANNRKPPHKLCAGCEEKLAALSDQKSPCAVPGCTRQAVFTRQAQLVAGAPDGEVVPPTLRCDQCEGVYRKLKDRSTTCGINGCKEKWLWSADEQIQAYAAGLPNEPPRRMGPTCEAAFGAIADRQVRCRTSGCKKTWTWSRSDQLDACLAGKPAPKAPHRMCESCISIYQALKDVERPCRRSGCKGTWLDKRGGQLARAVRGKTGDPYPQYCESCAKEIDDLEDRQLPCKTENCAGSWTWAKAAQLAAGVRPTRRDSADDEPVAANIGDGGGEPAGTLPPVVVIGGESPEAAALPPEGQPVAGTVAARRAPGQPGHSNKKNKRKRRREVRPPERRCQACTDFLKDKKTVEIPCKTCATPIYWPPESQLQTHLGAWAAPGICGACKRDATEAARAIERETLRQTGGGLVPQPEPAPEPADAPSAEAAPPAASPTADVN
jgi:hypothetical protein